jgi:hypothetical protein
MRMLLAACGIAMALAGCGGGERVVADRSTPRKAVLSLILSFDERDPERMISGEELKKYFASSSDPACLAAMIQIHEVSARLRRAAIERYGRDSAGQLDGLGPLKEDRAAYEAAQETIAGDRAQLVVAGQSVELVRESGEWRLQLAAGQDAQAAARVLDAYAQALRQVADDIPTGKLDESDRDKTIRRIRAILAAQRDAALASR